MPNSAIYSNFEFELLGNAILYWNGAKDPEIGYAHWILLGNFINGLKKKIKIIFFHFHWTMNKLTVYTLFIYLR